MTAKIKLNAASGGGSFSLQAPSSSSNNRVLTLPDAADGIVAQTDSSGNFSVSGTTTCSGNLKVGTITDTSGNKSSTTAQIADGRAKVWIKFNQDTGSIASSFNVSSISQQAAGLHTVNFSSNMASANYVTVTGLTAYYGFGTTDLRYPVHVDDQATNLVKVRCQQVANGGGYANSANAMLAVFGD
jgi:hypothetical protein